jgi:hypothetical protein
MYKDFAMYIITTTPWLLLKINCKWGGFLKTMGSNIGTSFENCFINKRTFSAS